MMLHRAVAGGLSMLLLMPAAHAVIVTGAGPGGGPHVRVFSGTDGGTSPSDLFPYPINFTGGVRVAAGDVTGDGIPDIITGTGPGGLVAVKVFDGRTDLELKVIEAENAFTGGIFVASGDFNRDGFDDIYTATDAETAGIVRVFDGVTGNSVYRELPYGTSFTGGVRVAAGDVNGDGFDDIITGPGPGSPPVVKVIDAMSLAEIASFDAYDTNFTGGVFVAAGDVNNDGFDDIITGADAGGGPHVRVFDGQTGGMLNEFFAYDLSFSGGVRVAAGDVNNDGLADIITAPGPGAGPHVKVFNGLTGAETGEFFAYDVNFTGGVYVAAFNVPEPSSVGISCVLLGGLLTWRGSRRRGGK